MRIPGLMAAALLAAVAVGLAGSQPPPGGPKDKGKEKGRFEPGRALPPPLRTELNLTPEQEKELAAIERDLKAKLDALLTADQKKQLEALAARGPGGPGGKGGGPADLGPDPLANAKLGPKLTLRGALTPSDPPFSLSGDAITGVLGDSRLEHNGGGAKLLSGVDHDKDGRRAGAVSFTANRLNDEKGRWFRVRVRGLAQDGFAVEKDALFVKVEFFRDAGKNALDFVAKSIYPQVEAERKGFKDDGTNRNLGAALWRTYALDVRTPFPEVDTLRVSVGFDNGTGAGAKSEFWVAEVEVLPTPDPADYVAPIKGEVKTPPALKSLVRLGGRWYYDPRGGDKTPPKQFDHTNVDRLFYLTDRLETPFVGNVSAWLRRGYQDRAGNAVEKDTWVEDAVVLTFTETHLVMRSKNLPNHPAAVFPDRSRFLDGNPNVIREQRNVWYIPLEPKANPSRGPSLTPENNRALPMGPVGVAVNGVVFFNPFDGPGDDAVWRLDRCCGHPSPGSEYHYHKYPVCVNTAWNDDGSGHSPLIGFAFDGFPVYGPYESKGVLAKDAKENPLNGFNLHEDAARGPHYHVTPGRFPHILGGYWGVVEPLNRGKKGPKN